MPATLVPLIGGGIHVGQFSIERGVHNGAVFNKKVLKERWYTWVHVGKLLSQKVIQSSVCSGHDRFVKFNRRGC